MSEFADVIIISQMTPGPIAINSATFVGTRIAGFGGAVVATVGCILPSTIIVLLLAMLYKKYKNLKYVQGVLKSLQPAVVGLIASAGAAIIAQALWGELSVWENLKSVNIVAVLLIAVCLFILRKAKISPIIIMLGAGAAGGLIYSFI